jgi:hypothetical protein
VVGGALDGGLCVEMNHLWTGGKRSDPPAAIYAKAEAEFVVDTAANLSYNLSADSYDVPPHNTQRSGG